MRIWEDRYSVEKSKSEIPEEDTSDSIYYEIAKIFYPLYTKYIEPRQNFVQDIEQNLIEADKNEVAGIYLSARLGFSVLLGVLFGFVSSFITISILTFRDYTIFFPRTDYVPTTIINWVTTITGGVLLTGVYILVFTVLFSVIGMLATKFMLRSAKKDRQKEINALLPDTIAFMYTQSVGGKNRIDIIRDVAEAKDTYGEVSTEFSRIVHYMDTFSEDPHTAISRVATTTPSTDLSEFLNDMLSSITAGGAMDTFLESQLNDALAEAEQTQEAELEDLELFLQIYITLSVLPVIAMVVGGLGSGFGFIGIGPLVFITYFLTAGVQTLAIGVVTILFTKEYGSGKLTPDEGDSFEIIEKDATKLTSAGVAERYKDEGRLFRQIHINEIYLRLLRFLSNPIKYIRRHPEYVFIISGPLAVFTFIVGFLAGDVPLTFSGWSENAFDATVAAIYLPLVVGFAPYAVFSYLKERSLGRITDGLTTDLNKLANTNEQGITFRESILYTSRTGDTRLSDELNRMYKKQDMGVELGKSIIEANNKYKKPRLARIFRIIKSAQEVSTNITEVLKTASNLSAAQDDIQRERKKKTRSHIGVVFVIFLVFIAAVVMLDQLLLNLVDSDTLGSLGVLEGNQPVSKDVIRLFFYHGAIVQGGIAGLLVGYISTGELHKGVKYSLGMISVAMLVWFATGVLL